MNTFIVKTSSCPFGLFLRRFCSVAQFPSGLEYAEAMAKIGKSRKVDSTAYKVNEYYAHNKWTFYDLEKQLGKYRLPQPSPDRPDAPRQTSTTASKTS
uniref:NADH dehydrogenase [ubiquinone] flavoprotein 3, mitochondrial n=1 Tax=Trichuris muris TaxID=70415 RepID=A0A5S6QN18_TRIMR